jgi:hypothetical protein
MMRFVFHLLSAISLLLLVAIAALWTLGEFRTDEIKGDFVDRRNNLLSDYWTVSELGWIELRWSCASYTHISPLMKQQPFEHLAVAFPNWHVDAPQSEITFSNKKTDIVICSTPEGDMRLSDIRSPVGVPTISSYHPLDGHAVRVVLPYWFITLATSITPAFWLWRWRKRRSLKRVGACKTCGYDLRASPTRCPECGSPSSS